MEVGKVAESRYCGHYYRRRLAEEDVIGPATEVIVECSCIEK